MASAPVEVLQRERDDALRRSASLERIIELINSELALQPLLTRIAEAAVELTGARSGGINLLVQGAAGPVLRTFALVNIPEPDPEPDLPEGEGLSWRVVRERRPICVDRFGDVASPTVLAALPQYADVSMACIPIWWADEIIGVFFTGDTPPRRFDEADVEILTTLARHAAIAIHNARLVDDLQEALRTTRLMYETSRRISVAHAAEDLIAAYVDHVAAGSRYYCSVALYKTDADGRRIELSVHRRSPGGKPAPLDRFQLSYEMWAPGLEPLVDAGEVVLIRDVETDERVSEALRQWHRDVGLPAMAMIPLIAGEHRLGFVALTYPEPHDWEEADLRPLVVTAAQLAMAIESRRQQTVLIEQEERRRLARELHDSVTQSLVAMNLLAQALPRLWEVDSEHARRSLAQLGDLTRASLVEMRALLFELRLLGYGGVTHHGCVLLCKVARELARGWRTRRQLIGRRSGAPTFDSVRPYALPVPSARRSPTTGEGSRGVRA